MCSHLRRCYAPSQFPCRQSICINYLESYMEDLSLLPFLFIFFTVWQIFLNASTFSQVTNGRHEMAVQVKVPIILSWLWDAWIPNNHLTLQVRYGPRSFVKQKWIQTHQDVRVSWCRRWARNREAAAGLLWTLMSYVTLGKSDSARWYVHMQTRELKPISPSDSKNIQVLQSHS